MNNCRRSSRTFAERVQSSSSPQVPRHLRRPQIRYHALGTTVSEVELLYHDDTYVLATAGRLMVTCYWDAPKVEHILKITELGLAWDRANENRTAFAQFIVDGTPRFASEVRDAATNIAKSKMFRLGTANVVEVGGLRGSATRAFLSTVSLLSRSSYPYKVYANPEDAADWLVGLLETQDPGVWSVPRILAIRERALAGRG